MVPFKKALTVRRGDSKRVSFRVRERAWDAVTEEWVAGAYRDLTGWQCRSQMRETADSEAFLAFTATVADQTVYPGLVELRLSHTQTAGLTYEKGVWDCELVDPDGMVNTYIEGTVKVVKDVTRV